MKLDFRNNRDFFAGIMFIAIGSMAMIGASNYKFGSTLRMGPGYLPTLLSGIIILFGIYITIKGLRNYQAIKGSWSLRSLILLPLAMVAFGVLIDTAGFIPALVALIVISALAGKPFKLVECLLMVVFLVGLTSAVFIYGLGLPFQLIKGF